MRARAVCSLRGWPAVTVLQSGGRAVIAKVTDVAFDDLGPVPDRRVTLRPGRSAVLTVTGPGEARGCATAWSVALEPGRTSGSRGPAGRAQRRVLRRAAFRSRRSTR